MNFRFWILDFGLRGMVHRVGRCVGATLWRRPRLELWICPEGVREHSHPGQVVEVMVLWGRGEFWRRASRRAARESIEIGPKSWWRWLTIPEGWLHGFSLSGRLMVFVNRTNGKSPAENLVWRSYPDGAA